jgi:hypothetical protein
MMQTFLKEDKNRMINLVEICYGVVSTMETDFPNEQTFTK